MQKNIKNISKKQSGISRRNTASTNDDTLRRLAFNNTAQPYIITIANNGKVIMTNGAAAKLLGYSKKELLTINSADIFDIDESSFKKMLKKRTAGLPSIAIVTAIFQIAEGNAMI